MRGASCEGSGAPVQTNAGRLFRGVQGQQTGGRVGDHDERSDTSSSRAGSAEGESYLDSLPMASPLPSPPHSLLGILSLGDSGRDAEAGTYVPQWRRKVKFGKGYENECRSKAYAYVTECGGGGDFRVSGILPVAASNGLSHDAACACVCARNPRLATCPLFLPDVSAGTRFNAGRRHVFVLHIRLHQGKEQLSPL